MKFIFGMQINTGVFYKLILSFWVCVARHAQSTPPPPKKEEVRISLQYLEKNVGDGEGGEVDFLPADKH